MRLGNNYSDAKVIGALGMLLAFVLGLLGCGSEKTLTVPQSLNLQFGETVKPNYVISFPKDHGAHAKQGIEWWYLTSNLETQSGKQFGVQWTLFRARVDSETKPNFWWDGQFYFAHFAVQDDSSHQSFERFARVNQAGISINPFNAFIDDWHLASTEDEFLPLKLSAIDGDVAVNLTLTDSPVVFHGDNGYSVKTQSGHASYYFSYPFLKATGELIYKGQRYQVTGDAWYDREWSASLLDRNQLGWDWFSIQDTNSKNGLMLFCIRDQNNQYDNCSGSHINENGEVVNISNEEVNLEVIDWVKLDNTDYPSQWRLKLDGELPIYIDTVVKDSRNQLTIPYWEGRIRVSGGMSGRGYAEMTGY